MFLLFSQMETKMVLGCGVLLIEVDFECTLGFTKNAWIIDERRKISLIRDWHVAVLIIGVWPCYKGTFSHLV